MIFCSNPVLGTDFTTKLSQFKTELKKLFLSKQNDAEKFVWQKSNVYLKFFLNAVHKLYIHMCYHFPQ